MSRLVEGATLVTGGGSGIGRAIALALAAEGAPVAVLDLQPKGGQETVAQIEAAGGRAAFVPVDVRNWDDVDRAFGEAISRGCYELHQRRRSGAARVSSRQAKATR